MDWSLVKNLIYLYTKSKKNLELSIGLIHEKEIEFKIFGEEANELLFKDKSYEIGSITKNFTTSLLCKAINDGKVCLNDKVFDNISILQLATHTSGIEELLNFDSGSGNPFSGFNSDDLLKVVKNYNFKSNSIWKYSNSGIALMSTVFEKKYQDSFYNIMTKYIINELKLKNTHFGDTAAELKGYNNENLLIGNMDWKRSDVFLSAGGLISTMSDMLIYLKSHMSSSYLNLAHIIQVNTDETFDMGLAWMIDKESKSVWNIGITQSFSSFIGFDKDKINGIVILSNYPGLGFDNTPYTIGLSYLKSL